MVVERWRSAGYVARLVAALLLVSAALTAAELGRLRVESDADVEVIWEGVSLGTTNAEGVMAIGDIPLGEYSVTLVKRGYISRKVGVVISEGETVLSMKLSAREAAEQLSDAQPSTPQPSTSEPSTPQSSTPAPSTPQPTVIEARRPTGQVLEASPSAPAGQPVPGGSGGRRAGGRQHAEPDPGTPEADEASSGSEPEVRSSRSAPDPPERALQQGSLERSAVESPAQRAAPPGGRDVEEQSTPRTSTTPAVPVAEPGASAEDEPASSTDEDPESRAVEESSPHSDRGGGLFWPLLLGLALLAGCAVAAVVWRRRNSKNEEPPRPERIERQQGPVVHTIDAVQRPSFLRELRQRESEMEKTIDG